MSDWTIASLATAIAARRISPVEITQECLARIERLDPKLRAFITVDADGALRAAKTLEHELGAGQPRGPLHGVPLAWKDLCYVPGLPTSCGTKTKEYFVDERECEAVRRLRSAGAVGLGKLNMVELALGAFGDNPHHGDVQNPWRPGHSAGGSSSGSGAAVAAGLALGAVGSDTGGSIRLPAACCGIVGLKPTYGRVSRAGVMALSWSLDHLGPMTRTVADAALMLGAMAGHDAADGSSSRRAVLDYMKTLERGIVGLRVGVPENYYFDGVSADMAAAVREAAKVMAGLGAKVTELRVPDPRPMIDAANVIIWSESTTIHARAVRDQPDELSPVSRTRLQVGFQVSAYEYLQAARLRARLTRDFVREVFTQVDALVAPVIPEPAPALAEAKSGTPGDVIARMARFSRLTRPFNGLGLPALALPCGVSADGLPLALQIVGRAFDEGTVLRIGHAYEQAAGWWTRRPGGAS